MNLVEIAQSHFTPDVIARGATAAGIAPDTAARLAPALVPALLAAMAARAAEPAGALAIADAARAGSAGGTIAERIGAIADGAVLPTVPDAATGAATDAAADATGVARGEAGALATSIAAALTAIVGDHLAGSGDGTVTGSGVAALFAGERGHIAAALPPGVRASLSVLPGMGWLRSVATVGAVAAAPAVPISGAPLAALSSSTPRRADPPRRFAGGWGVFFERSDLIGPVPWVLAAIAAVAVLLTLGRRSHVAQAADTPVAVVNAARLPSARPAAQTDDGAVATLNTAVPSGVRLLVADAAYTGERCNAEFAALLTGAEINFATASAAVESASKPLLDTLAALAGKCSGHKVTVAGYTDTVGDAASNRALSRDRAASVANYLIGEGVAPGQLGAIGYGEARQKQATADETANAANRRIEISVTG